jgi:hypothetical protein
MHPVRRLRRYLPEFCLRLVDVTDLRGDEKLESALIARYGRVPNRGERERSSRMKPVASAAVYARPGPHRSRRASTA